MYQQTSQDGFVPFVRDSALVEAIKNPRPGDLFTNMRGFYLLVTDRRAVAVTTLQGVAPFDWDRDAQPKTRALSDFQSLFIEPPTGHVHWVLLKQGPR